MTKITSKSLSQVGSAIVAVVVLLVVVGGDRVVGFLVVVTRLSEVSVRLVAFVSLQRRRHPSKQHMYLLASSQSA